MGCERNERGLRRGALERGGEETGRSLPGLRTRAFVSAPEEPPFIPLAQRTRSPLATLRCSGERTEGPREAGQAPPTPASLGPSVRSPWLRCLLAQLSLAVKGSCPPYSSHSPARSLAFARDDRSLTDMLAQGMARPISCSTSGVCSFEPHTRSAHSKRSRSP